MTCPKCKRHIVVSDKLPQLETEDGEHTTVLIPVEHFLLISCMCPYVDCHYIWKVF